AHEFPAGTAIPRILHASEDARDVGDFIQQRSERDGFVRIKTELTLLTGPNGTAGAAEAALKGLLARPSGRGPARGDSVFVFVNSHFVDFGAGRGSGLLGV